MDYVGGPSGDDTVDRAEPVGTLPGVARLSPDRLLRELERGLKLGVRAAMLFGVVPGELKDPAGSRAGDPNGPVAEALRAARRAFGNDLVLMSDVCLCGYTDHGHCGLLRPTPRGVVIDNDPSLEALARMAVTHAEAGAAASAGASASRSAATAQGPAALDVRGSVGSTRAVPLLSSATLTRDVQRVVDGGPVAAARGSSPWVGPPGDDLRG